VAIALCSTALGTLLPILRDSGLLDTRLGQTVLNHGAFGEVGPVIAMAVLLGTRGSLQSTVVLILFTIAAVAVGLVSDRILRQQTWLTKLVPAGAETTAQTTVRVTMFLLVGLMVLAYEFELDTVLGAFAAGFILRRLLPEGHESLETKLDGIAFGFLIPIFFITSGMGIDIAAVFSKPGLLVVLVLLIIAVRGFPVFIATRWDRGQSGTEPPFSIGERAQLGLYSATGLPLIVAVTGVAVAAGEMTEANASVLVTAGAVTVLALPFTASMIGARRKRLRTSSEISPEGRR
jgi:Kef-type K+ transport system membrane component KefB